MNKNEAVFLSDLCQEERESGKDQEEVRGEVGGGWEEGHDGIKAMVEA